MPELPEVEAVRRSLEPAILGRRIVAIETLRADYLTPRDAPLACIVGHAFARTLRHGKKLFCALDDGQTLLFHLGMTGFIEVVAADTPPEPHTHVVLALAEHRVLRMSDPRRFGGLWYYPSLDAALQQEVIGKMGPDALALTAADLAGWRDAPRTATLKARLMNQRDIAGLGNIYVDESLWRAGLHPLQRVRRLQAAEIRRLVAAIHALLSRSIAFGGTTIRDFRNTDRQPGAFGRKLHVYGRGGQPCHRCRTLLAQALVAGRTTVHCPRCQRRH
jgi:formamidopyrimidine-DNA glycosylase